MRMIFAVTLIAGSFIGSLAATAALAANTPQQDMMKSCSAKWTAMSAADKGKTKRTEFMSSCMKAPAASAAMAGPAMAMKPAAAGTMAMKPAAAGSMAMTAKPAAGSMAMKPVAASGGQAKCKDGTTVTYKNRMGTCSGHGGVDAWL
jgi:hypothetical protein